MSKCSQCGADTILYESGVPFCVKCAEAIDAARKQTAQADKIPFQPRKVEKR